MDKGVGQNEWYGVVWLCLGNVKASVDPTSRSSLSSTLRPCNFLSYTELRQRIDSETGTLLHSDACASANGTMAGLVFCETDPDIKN